MIEKPQATEKHPPSTLGGVLYELRGERGLSQRELGRRAGLAATTIGSYEAGHLHPSRQHLSHLARALAVPEAELARLLPQRSETTPFGRALRELREQRGWTQRQLAARMGWDSELISNYEVTGTQPGPKNLAAIATALGVPQRRLRALLTTRTPKKQHTPFGRLLLKARSAAGLTRQQLARTIGLPTATVASYETGNTYPGKKHLSGLVERLAEALALDPAEIATSLSQPRRPDPPTPFGRRLRQLRTDRDLSQEQLGARCGCNLQFISRYETGRSYPKPDVLPALARALGVEAAQLTQLLPALPAPRKPTPLGNELRRRRNQLGLTQEQLAMRIGVDPTSISGYESRAKRPESHTLAALAGALDLSPEQLEGLLPPQETTPLGRELRRLRRERRLTVEQLASRIGCARRTILLYERGHSQPSTGNLAALGEALGVPLGRLTRQLPPQPRTTQSGAKLRQLRQECGLTQQELATRVGCGLNTISSYESGKSRPSAPHLSALARALGVDQQQLAVLSSQPETTRFGRELRLLRKRCGLPQQQLAARSGVSHATISRYESGQQRPPTPTLTALAQALGVHRQQLAELLPPPLTTIRARLGRELRQLRKQRRFSQQQLATRSGLSQTTISSYERGQKCPRTADLAALARALGLSREELERWNRLVSA